MAHPNLLTGTPTQDAAPSYHYTLTPRTLELFLAFARDAGNWSGTPLIGGNVGGSREDRGNITQMKRAGLVTTYNEAGDSWLSFTPAGVAFATTHGIEIKGV